MRYHGGKWMLAPWICSHLPAHRTYVEPFCGAASVLMRKPRSTMEVINDRNGRLVSALRVIRDREGARELARLLRLTPYAKAEFEAASETADDPIEDTRRLLVLAGQGHSGTGATGLGGPRRTGWRRGDRGTQSTSAQDWAGLPDHVQSWCERLCGVYIENAEALEVIERYDRLDALFYVDPPYLHSTRGKKRAYHYEMTDDEHRALAERLRCTVGAVVISGYPSDLYDRELYPDWQRVERSVWTGRGTSACEVLWISPNARPADLPLFAVHGTRAA